MLQAYHMKGEYLRGISAATAKRTEEKPHDELGADGLRVCKVALQELGGRFSADEIYARLGPVKKGGVSWKVLQAMVLAFRGKGWVIEAPDDTRARIMAPALIEIVNRYPDR